MVDSERSSFENRTRQEYCADMALRRLAQDYGRVGLEVIGELIAETEPTRQVHARPYARKLHAYVGEAQQVPANDAAQAAMAWCITMAALALGIDLSALYKMIEDRLPARA